MDTNYTSGEGFKSNPIDAYIIDICRRFMAGEFGEIYPQPEEEPYLTKAEVAQLLNRSTKQVDNYRKAGMPCHYFGRTPMFRKSEILSFLETC